MKYEIPMHVHFSIYLNQCNYYTCVWFVYINECPTCIRTYVRTF